MRRSMGAFHPSTGRAGYGGTHAFLPQGPQSAGPGVGTPMGNIRGTGIGQAPSAANGGGTTLPKGIATAIGNMARGAYAKGGK